MGQEFKDRLLEYARTAVKRAGKVQNEESTKQFLIIPFLQLLGYDPLDPDEVIPEADASFSDKHKNRVDYAVYKSGDPVIAIEAKKVGALSAANRGELKGYYNAVPSVKLGILTDGLIYQLYSDTEQENLMDNEPFAVVDLSEIAQEQIGEDAFDALLKLRREVFNPVDIGADARRRIYISAYVDALEQTFKDPHENMVKVLMDLAKIEGRRTNKLLAEQKSVVAEAINQFFDKKLLERVGFAEREDLIRVPAPDVSTTVPKEASDNSETEVQSIDDTSGIVTTEIEMEVFNYVSHRLPFLIERDEDLFGKLRHISYRDFKGIFAVSYKQDRKGRLFNLRDTPETRYRFEFPASGAIVITDDLSDMDDELLAVFLKRVEDLG